ncbi:MAG: LytR/AlgR family response regulator transcription factor [Calditrichia bacterium]
MNISYIIVDDEPIAHRVIETYCKDLAFMNLQANCYDALQALDFLRDNQPDIIFLDMNMPKLRGFDFLRTLDNPPQVIVTSAHKEFALEGFELSVCDYLLKPFGFERFLKAVNKAINTFSAKAPEGTTHVAATMTGKSGKESLFLKGEKKYHQVAIADILFVEAKGNYCELTLPKKVILTPEKISVLAKTLPSSKFMRVHKSFIAGITHIEEIEGNMIHIGKATLPIGRVYRKNVDELLKNS